MMKIKITLIFFLLAGFLLLNSSLVIAEEGSSERILDYRSDIIVNKDSSMVVNETIKVLCQRQIINHGIYRDFPTRYRDRYGNRVVVGFEVLSVLKDGEPENYWVEGMKNGKRVYIGNEDVYLDAGTIYTYSIKYKTTRQLGFFKDHDELYWNVTGNGWDFEIDDVQTSVTLPDGITWENISTEGYTGRQGAKGQDYNGWVDESTNKARFMTTSKLGSREGLTIVVSFPKGFVKEPTRDEKINWIIEDNIAYIYGVGGLIILFIFYMFIWSLYGRDIPRGTIIPLFEPPMNLPPSAVRYIRRMGYDNKVFAANLIDIAIKRYIKIMKLEIDYEIEKVPIEESGIREPLPHEENIVFTKLLEFHDSIELENSNHKVISGAIDSLKGYLAKSYLNKYFKTNSAYIAPGIILSLATYVMIAMVMLQQLGEETIVFFLVGSIFASVGLSLLIFLGIPSWLRVFKIAGHRLDNLGNSCAFTIMGLVFGGIGIIFLFLQTSIIIGIIIAMLVFTNVLFYYLLKAPTREGRKLIDQIDGFRMYLSVAEGDTLKNLNLPEKTLGLYEKFLPYALALDVEQEWSEQFADVLKTAGQGGSEYSPTWFAGGHYGSFATGGFASSLGSSFTGAISSSSTAPGSSSGGGGGGSSGGGGGGGGGGW